MIVVRIELDSAISESRDSDLGTLCIDNVTDRAKAIEHRGRVCDYRARMYRKGALAHNHGDANLLAARAKPTREFIVKDHRRHDLPVQTLVARALEGMGYLK